MKTLKYNKLIRDNIPEIIKASGKERDVSILNDEEYILKLKDKIVEEAHEVVSAREDEIIGELADVLEIIEDVRRIPSSILMYDTKNLTYIESGNPGFHRMLRDDYHYAFQQVPDLTRVKEDCIKLSIYCPENIEGIMDRAFLPKWENRVKAAYSGDCYLDCMKKGSNKGHALSEIQKLYGISKEETMVFGDNLNDIEMLLQADHSFAMANARKEVRKAARYVASPYWEDGVLAQIKTLIEE